MKKPFSKKVHLFCIFILLSFFLFNSCDQAKKIIVDNNKTQSEEEYDLIPVKIQRNGFFQYIDTKGTTVIASQFERANYFSNGLALVKVPKENGKYGFINKNGSFVIQPEYEEATTFNEGLAWVVREGGIPEVIDTTGKLVFGLKEAEDVKNFSEGLAPFSVKQKDTGDCLWGYVNKSGTVVIQPQYSQVGSFSNGKASVPNDEDQWGYIDKNGHLIINYQFDAIRKFDDNDCAVVGLYNTNEIKSYYGLIDNTGKYLINPRYDHLYSIGKGLYAFRENGKYGWCNKTGEILVQPQFDRVLPFSAGDLLPINIGGRCGYADKDGKIVINPQFNNSFSFHSSYAIVEIGGKNGLIDQTGKFIVNPQFEQIGYSTFNDNFNRYYSNWVTTDYFDIESFCLKLQKLITATTIDGHSYNSNMEFIKDKYDLSEYHFSKNDSSFLLKMDDFYDENSDISLYMLGTPWKKESDGWFDYIDVFNSDYIPDGYAVQLFLKNRAEWKGELLVKAIYESFTKKKFSEAKENSDGYIFFNSNHLEIILDTYDDVIIILIKRIV